MTIDWTKEVEARKDDLLEDLQNLLRINSERDDAQATPEAPFGPGPVAGLKHMFMNQSLKMAKFMHVVQAMIKAQVWLLITQ